MSKTKLLMGASALIAAATAMAGAASAQTQVYGGGSTLIAPYARQVEDCYGTPTALVNQGAFPYVNNETTNTVSPFFYAGAVPFNCGTQHVDTSVQLNYIGSGSGNGIASFFGHDATTFWGDTVPGTSPSPYPSIQYASSDASLATSDVAHYDCVGSTDCTEGSSGSHTLETIIGALSTTTPSGTTYANPLPLYGNLIQVPLLVAPVAIAYSPVYKEVASSTGTVTYYKFTIHKPNKDTSGGLLLDMPTVCAIFNGQITNWNDPALKVLNGNASLRDTHDPVPEGTPTTAGTWEYTGPGGGLPIELVGRSDSSGTTSIFVRALAAQCGTTGVTYTEGGDNYTYNNNYPAAGSKTLLGLNGGSLGPVYTVGTPNNGSGDTTVPVPGQFTTVKGSGGVATYVAFTLTPPANATYTQGRLAYLGPDYVLPAVLSTGQNTFGLNVANISYLGKVVEPTAATAIKAFGTGTTAYLPPQSNSGGVFENGSSGHVPAANSLGLRSHPDDWALPISTTVSYEGAPAIPVSLAVPTTAGAYPIVGTTVGLFYTCYNNTGTQVGVPAQIQAFLKYYETNLLVNDAKNGVLAKAGLAPLPKAWTTAINATFVTPTASAKSGNQLGTDQLNLNILAAGTAASGTHLYGGQCHTVAPGA